MEFALTPQALAVVIGVVVLGILGSYQLGRRLSPAAVPTVTSPARPGADPELDVAAVRRGEPDPSVLDVRSDDVPPVPSRMVTPTPPPAPSRSAAAVPAPKTEDIGLPSLPAPSVPPRVSGLNYIVVERFHTGLPNVKSLAEARQHAEQAQKWLLEKHQLETAIYPMSNGKGFELWTVRGFKHPEETPDRDKLANQIRSYGKAYAAIGRYLFGCEIRKYQKPG